MRIVVADDHAVLLDALKLALTELGHDVVGAVTSLESVLPVVGQTEPDVCLLDLNFPEGSSIPLVAQLRVAVPRTKIVLLTAETSSASVLQAIAAGANGFVVKTRPIADVVEACELSMSGHLAVDPALLKTALQASDSRDDPLWALQFLTDREWQVLRCIVDGMSTDEVAVELRVRRSTARTHVQNVLTKLGVHSRLQAVALVTAHGSQSMWPAHLR